MGREGDGSPASLVRLTRQNTRRSKIAHGPGPSHARHFMMEVHGSALAPGAKDTAGRVVQNDDRARR